MPDLIRRCRPLLGTFVEISAEDDAAIEGAFAAIEQVHRLMSAHEPESDLSRINRFAHLRPVKVHEWSAQVLKRAIHWAEQSDGAFDPVRAGRSAIERRLIPQHSDQPEAQARQWTALSVDGCSARLSAAACIDLGGIAKGFAIDRAVDLLRAAGCSRGLVNAGGDLRCFGAEAWPAFVVEPSTRQPLVRIDVQDSALATSGGLPGEDALSFDHLGGESDWTSVTVLAAEACDADALTKIAWARSAQLRSLLASAGARAIGVRASGEIEPIGQMEAIAA